MKHHFELLWPFYDFYAALWHFFFVGVALSGDFGKSWQIRFCMITCPQKLLWVEAAQRHMSRKCFYPTSKCQSLWTIFGVRLWSWETAWEFLYVLESEAGFFKGPPFLWFLAILDKNSQWKNHLPVVSRFLGRYGSRSWSFQFSLYKFVETILKVSGGTFGICSELPKNKGVKAEHMKK